MKVAIIGRGFGAYAMQPAFEARGWKTSLVPSRDKDAVDEACAGDFDLIAVHSPPFQHRDHVLRAIAAGKDVLCDKPFGANEEDARAMRDAAKDAGVLHFLNFEFRHQPAMVEARDLIAAGEIGSLRHISTVAHAAYMAGREHGWLSDAQLGGGWIGAWGSHMIDTARWLTGSEYTHASAITRIDVPERPGPDGKPVRGTAEDAFVATMQLADGTTVMLDAAFAVPVSLPVRTRLVGTRGAIEIADQTHLTLLREGEEPDERDFTPGGDRRVWPALTGWIEAIEGALASRTQIAPNFDDGVATAEVMERLKV